MNREEWPKLRKFLVDGFRSNTRDHWTKIFHSKRPIMDTAYWPVLVTDLWNKDTDSCAVPVLSPSEAAELSSEEFPLPQPSLSRTYPWKVAELSGRPLSLSTGEHTEEILDEFGIVASEKAALMAEGALGPKRSKL